MPPATTIPLGIFHEINHVRPLSDSPARCDPGLFSQLFPRPVGVAALQPWEELPLFPEEEHAVGNSIAKRRIEFAGGRYCARIAMTELGFSPCAIPGGPDGAPVWPLGLVGSITHSMN